MLPNFLIYSFLLWIFSYTFPSFMIPNLASWRKERRRKKGENFSNFPLFSFFFYFLRPKLRCGTLRLLRRRILFLCGTAQAQISLIHQRMDRGRYQRQFIFLTFHFYPSFSIQCRWSLCARAGAFCTRQNGQKRSSSRSSVRGVHADDFASFSFTSIDRYENCIIRMDQNDINISRFVSPVRTKENESDTRSEQEEWAHLSEMKWMKE